MISFFLSCKLPPNTEGSAEQNEAIGASVRTQVRIFKSCNLCQILHSFPYFFITFIPDRFLPSFKNDRQVFNTIL